MKRIFILMLMASATCYGQHTEFTTYANGLIYDESTMRNLENIVDSLNLKFKACELSKSYYSFPQGFATWVKIPNNAALKKIKQGVSISDYRKSYPTSIRSEKLWILKTTWTNYEDVQYVEYSGLPSGGDDPSITLVDNPQNNKTSGWIVNPEGKQAFHFGALKSLPLSKAYSTLVQYVDCMIDTTAEIYFPKAESRIYQRVEENSKAHEFIEWANSYPGKPEYPDYEIIDSLNLDIDSVYTIYFERKNTWDSLRLLHLDKEMKILNSQTSLLSEACAESLKDGNSDAELEFYVSRYLSKADALKLMRSRKVMGNCSQDQSPRYHAMNICKLAAETTQWDIFLRSHLDIMNDRFERQTDGSYAWAGRKTYLKEIEELDINAIDLLLGTSLQVENVAENHYRGSISRIGRALTDASNKDELERRIVMMIGDSGLDPYNRLLMGYLFSHYAHNHEDDSTKNALLKKLENAVASWPEHLREVWKNE